ncbi:MAG: hypothetical protein J6S67_16405 [Methanobrevibacter sp.]|nr:hypothetical protein [Methanobrevibacter sp.]
MTYTQIYSLINDLLPEALGAKAITVKDTSTFVSAGSEVVSSATSLDIFYKGLIDRINKVFFESKAYSFNDRFTEVDTITFGAALAKVKVIGGQASNNDSRDAGTANSAYDVLGNQTVGTITNTLDLPSDTIGVRVKVYSKRATWEYSYVRPIDQITTAFTSEAEMAAFIGAIETEVMNNYHQAKEELVNLAIASGMALTINAAGANVRHVLTEYNALAATPIADAAHALMDHDFIAYTNKQIMDTVGYMGERGILYNSGAVPTFSDKDDLVVEILQEYLSAANTYAYSDTFHEEYIGLPNHGSVTRWQGTGTTGSFADRSTINVKVDGVVSAVEQGNIIACIRDKRAVFTHFNKVYSDSFYNPSKRTESVWLRSDDGFGVDDDYNMAVFIVD